MTLFEKFQTELSHLSSTNPLVELFHSTEIYDFDNPTDDVLDLSGFVGVGTDTPTLEFLNVFKNSNLSHMIQIKNTDIIYEIFIASMILKRPRLFLKNPYTILAAAEKNKNAKTRILTENFSTTERKSEIMTKISDFMGHNKNLERYKESILIIADELIANAMFNAPVTEKGTPIYRGIQRNETIRYPGDKKANIFICHTEVDLFIGCIDPWGSIDKNYVIQSLQRAYEKADLNSDNQGKVGAGIGLRMVLDRSRSLYILSEYMKKTLVCGHVRLNESLKKVDSTPKQVHIQTFDVE